MSELSLHVFIARARARGLCSEYTLKRRSGNIRTDRAAVPHTREHDQPRHTTQEVLALRSESGGGWRALRRQKRYVDYLCFNGAKTKCSSFRKLFRIFRKYFLPANSYIVPFVV